MFSVALESRQVAAYVLLRVGSGLMFTFHGLQKVAGVLSQSQPPVFSQLWLGGWIELVCGIAIAVGGFTRAAAFLASGTMAVAYVQYHWKLALGAQLLPAVNKGELALLYALLFLFIACRGPGIASVDGLRARATPRAS